MKLGTKIKELRIKEGFTQVQLSQKAGLTERTIQRIENHDVEPSKHSLKKIGEVLNYNFNEQKLNDMRKKHKILNVFLWGISLLIAAEFLLGVFNWNEHWWVIVGWFIPILGGISIPYYKRKQYTNKS